MGSRGRDCLGGGGGGGLDAGEGMLAVGAHHSLLVDDVLEPFEVLPLEAGEDKERVPFILLRPLHGTLGVGDAQGGLAAHVPLKALHGR